MKSKAKMETCPLPGRYRKRLSITIDPDHYEFIKKEGFKASKFMDNAINALKTNINYALMLITTGATSDPEKTMGPLRFELRTSAMSRRRHNQLDHEPNALRPYDIGFCSIKELVFAPVI